MGRPAGSVNPSGVEKEFLALAAAAADLPGAADQIRVSDTEHYEWNEVPLVTLAKLEVQGRLAYQAALFLLTRADLAAAAVTHVRSLVDFLAQVAWITGRSRQNLDRSERTRALCFEVGTSRALWGAFKSADPSSVPDGNVEMAEERMNAWIELHRQAGCTCSGRTSKGVSGTLVALEKVQLAGEKFPDLHTMGSVALHMQYPELTIRDAGGVSHVPGATYEERCRYLLWVVNLYGLGRAWFVYLETPDLVDQMRGLGEAVGLHPTLARGLSGQLDREAAAERRG